MEKLDYLFDFIKRNYLLSKKQEEFKLVSNHWDVFQNDLEKVIDNRKIWERMLRNSLTLGFNDALSKISNERFIEGNYSLWTDLKKNDFPDLVFDISDDIQRDFHLKLFRYVAEITDLTFLMKNCITDIGMPQKVEIEIKQNAKTVKLNCNLHDLTDIYHSWLIQKYSQTFSVNSPIICEIGGGYGGLATKVKNIFPNSKVIIFDLPEVSAVQTYYLSKVFEDSIIFGMEDFMKMGASILNQNFDFLILPGHIISKLLSKYSVDIFINVRSFMEMDFRLIKFYFEQIQNSLKPDGIFACFNRYEKGIRRKNSDKLNINRFVDYPFDEKWSVKYSEASNLQEHIHLLIANREQSTPRLQFKNFLKSIKYNKRNIP